MSKKILVISASPRKGGNSDTLCDEFIRGAQEAGNEAEKVFLAIKRSAIAPAAVSATARINVCSRMIWRQSLIGWYRPM